MTTIENEIIIKQSKLDKYGGYLFCILFFVFGLFLLTYKKDWRGIFLVIIYPVLYIWHNKEFKNDIILLKISDKALWTPKHNYKPWSTIIKVKFRYTGGGRSGYRRYLDIYRANEFDIDETIDLTSINLLSWTLKRRLKKYVRTE